MRKSSFLFGVVDLSIIIVSLFSCSVIESEEVVSNELKVLSWNVWHAGHSEAYPKAGCEGVIGMLKKADADVITMVETYGASDKVADSLGYYHRLLSSNLSIYSRYPIVETYTFPDSISTFNFGGVMINKNGKRIRIFDTWLHYLPDITKVPTELSEDEILAWDDAGSRDDEIRKILSTISLFIQEADSIPVIMAGDFNCHSHLDWTEKTRNMYDHNGAAVNWTVSRTMIEAGFKDSFREINPKPEEDSGRTWRYGNDSKNRHYRIDFIYYKGNGIFPVASESHNGLQGELYNFRGEDFLYASDHGFVLTTFELR